MTRRNKGDHGSGAALAGEIPYLRRYARFLVGNPHEADDLVQDCMVKAIKHFNGFPATSLRAWLFTILRNTHLDNIRRRGRRPSQVQDPRWDMIAVAGLSQTTWHEIRDLRRALDQLLDAQREALLLVVVEGMTYEQVADLTGVRVGTVRSRIFRARRALSRFVEGEVRSPSAEFPRPATPR